MNKICKKIRKDILCASKESGHGHIPTCFSVVEILWAVYDTMKHEPKNPHWPERDIFILSKGHAALCHYCVLSQLGYFEEKKVNTFGGFKSDLGCHADRFKVPGIEASTGSLGHGIGLATGIALGLKIKKSKRRVITLIGDGESNEGSVWEAVMVSVNLKLDNLTIIYDNNMSHSRGLQIMNPSDRFRSFGCSVFEVKGHSVDDIKEVLLEKTDKVKAVVADTRKGYGCMTLVRNHYEWHRRSPGDEEYKILIEELENEETV